MKKRLIVLFALALPAELCRSQENGANNNSHGKFLYEEYAGCASCHGADGKGNVEGVTLDPPPPDLSDCSFNSREPRRDWSAVIARGGQARGLSMSMPAYGEVLTPAQIDTIIDYLKTFCADASWPPGELNFRRPQITSKAFPENEALLIPTYTGEGSSSTVAKMVYEKRFGRRGHWEIAVPFANESGPPSAQGIGDIELSVKYVFAQHQPALFILSGGLETALPTGESEIGVGTGTWKLSPYLAAGKGFEAFFIQSSVKYETPLQSNKGESELFYNLAFTLPLTKEKKGLFPMVEFNGITVPRARGRTELFITPQLYLGLVRRGHIAFSLGSQIPVTRERPFDYRIVSFLLWEYADGGLWW
jgi:mono/diheme cytochrome c family protein